MLYGSPTGMVGRPSNCEKPMMKKQSYDKSFNLYTIDGYFDHQILFANDSMIDSFTG
jgi:hypothetical protein